MILPGLLAAMALALSAETAADDPLTRPIPSNPDWLTPQTPILIHGDTYYVGTGGLSLALIDTGDGLILIDGAVPQHVGVIKSNIRALGFRVEDIRYILNTEAHYDHSGGIAALARDSGATVLAGPAGAEALRRGRVVDEDPQAADIHAFPAVANVRAMADGETLTLGRVTVTTVLTPGHTPGSASWTWDACAGQDCQRVVFASSLNAIAADPWTFTAHPDVTARLRASIDRVEALDCDILISAHPNNSGGNEKLAGLEAGVSPNPFIDPDACRAYAARARTGLDRRLAEEASSMP